MKVLVTGAQGQVGSELILQGEELGLQVIATEWDDLDITRKEQVGTWLILAAAPRTLQSLPRARFDILQ